MKTIPLPTDKKDIDRWIIRTTSVALLGEDLVESDSHDEEGARMTENKEWYFVPCQDDFVMSRSRIGNPSVPTDRLKWRIEAVKVDSSRWDELEMQELVEVCERCNSLEQAIDRAALLAKEYEIQNIGEGIHWQAESLREKLGYYEQY